MWSEFWTKEWLNLLIVMIIDLFDLDKTACIVQIDLKTVNIYNLGMSEEEYLPSLYQMMSLNWKIKKL